MSNTVTDCVALIVFLLCAITSVTCAVLLLRGYRSSQSRLLLWSGLCFVGFSLNTLLVIVDFSLGPAVDLSVWRSLPSLAGLGCLLYGMIFDAD
jgi:hypothetical protein